MSRLFVTEAVDQVVVDHAGRLHQGIADGRTDEIAAAPLQVAAHGIRLPGAGRNFGQGPPGAIDRPKNTRSRVPLRGGCGAGGSATNGDASIGDALVNENGKDFNKSWDGWSLV